MNIKKISEVSNEVKQNNCPSDIEEANFEPSDYKIKKYGNLISTSKQCFSEDRLDQSFSTYLNNGKENEVNYGITVKDAGIMFINWIQIAVPNYYTNQNIIDKAESISEACYILLKKMLLENEGENFIDGGGHVNNILVADAPQLNEDMRVSATDNVEQTEPISVNQDMVRFFTKPSLRTMDKKNNAMTKNKSIYDHSKLMD